MFAERSKLFQLSTQSTSRWQNIFAVGFVIGYWIFPFDFWPDTIPFFGYFDDCIVTAVVAVWLSSRLRKVQNLSSQLFQASNVRPLRRQIVDSEQETPWGILEVSPDASDSEIDLAYRLRLAEYHPDRVQHLGKALRALAHERTIAIGTAYAEICAGRKRWANE